MVGNWLLLGWRKACLIYYDQLVLTLVLIKITQGTLKTTKCLVLPHTN